MVAVLFTLSIGQEVAASARVCVSEQQHSCRVFIHDVDSSLGCKFHRKKKAKWMSFLEWECGTFRLGNLLVLGYS